jgi:hypothetical protein
MSCVDLGIIHFDSVGFSLNLLLCTVLGAAVAPFLVMRIDQRLFEILI